MRGKNFFKIFCTFQESLYLFTPDRSTKPIQYRKLPLRYLNVYRMIDSRLSDSQIVSLYQNGNEEAFEMLLHRHKSKLYTAIYLIVKDRYTAEDLLQETFVKAIKTIRGGRYNEEGKFLPWISRIAHNLAIDHFRKDKRYPEVVLEDGSRVFNCLDFAEESAESKQVFRETRSKLRD